MTKQAPHETALADFGETSLRFRDLINEKRRRRILMKRKKNCFSKICSGMDYIDDILLGFRCYFERDDSGIDGERYYPYIEVIGILNCVQIQQNVIIGMYFLITGEKINLEEEYDEIKQIRDIRHKVASHPMDSNKEAHSINRWAFASEWHFEYISHSENDDHKFKVVELYPLFCQHLKILRQVLERIIGYMENEDDEHKNKFKDEKLADMIPAHNSIIKHLFKESYTTRDFYTKYIGEKLDEFENALSKRGEHFLEDGVIPDAMPKIRYALFNCSNSIDYNDDNHIYASFVVSELKKLEKVAQQIDADYSGQPLQEEKQVIVCMPSSNRLIIKNKKDRKT